MVHNPSLLSVGTGVIKAVMGCVTSHGYSRGESPSVAVCVCVCPQKRKNATIEHPAIAPAILSPAPPPLPVLACTLTYSWSRFGDTMIKAFLCFSLSPLSSFSSVTRVLSAAVDIESSFNLTQSLFTSAVRLDRSECLAALSPTIQSAALYRGPKGAGPLYIYTYNPALL